MTPDCSRDVAFMAPSENTDGGKGPDLLVVEVVVEA